MAAPAIASRASQANNDVTTHAVALPSGISAGDLLLMVQWIGVYSTAATISGWFDAGSQLSSAVMKIAVKWRIASSGDAAGSTSYSWTSAGSSGSFVEVMRFASGDFDPALPVDMASFVVKAAATVDPNPLPTLTVRNSNSRVFGVWGSASTNKFSIADPPGSTTLERGSTTGANSPVSYLLDTVTGNQGDTLTRSYDPTGIQSYIALQFAVNPPLTRATPSLRSSAVTTVSTAATTWNVTLPSSISVGDLLVVDIGTITSLKSGAFTRTGWNQQEATLETTGDDTSLTTLTKVADSSDVAAAGTTIAFVSAQTVSGSAVALALADVDPAAFLRSPSTVASSGSTIAPAGISPDADNWTMLLFYASDIAALTPSATPPAGVTELIDTVAGSVHHWITLEKLTGGRQSVHGPSASKTDSTVGLVFYTAVVGAVQSTDQSVSGGVATASEVAQGGQLSPGAITLSGGPSTASLVGVSVAALSPGPVTLQGGVSTASTQAGGGTFTAGAVGISGGVTSASAAAEGGSLTPQAVTLTGGLSAVASTAVGGSLSSAVTSQDLPGSPSQLGMVAGGGSLSPGSSSLNGGVALCTTGARGAWLQPGPVGVSGGSTVLSMIPQGGLPLPGTYTLQGGSPVVTVFIEDAGAITVGEYTIHAPQLVLPPMSPIPAVFSTRKRRSGVKKVLVVSGHSIAPSPGHKELAVPGQVEEE